MTNNSVITLEEFRKMEVRTLTQATGELSNLLRDIALASKRIHVEVNKAGLGKNLGETGAINVQGEAVQQLDEYANKQFITILRRGISCAGIASEELDDFVAFDEPVCNNSKYVCVFDPLDGSNNIDVNISIGSIFGIYRRKSEIGAACNLGDFLQCGNQLVASGYIIYGSSTIFTYATKRGVNGFTLDQEIGEYTLSHPQIKCPPIGRYYSVNHGNYFQYPMSVQRYIEYCQKQADSKTRLFYRYTGCMVADIHRNLLKGGLFMYPPTSDKSKGKLRLVYECNPFAFIMEKAGGSATDGSQRILDLVPTTLHQRSPLYIGSNDMMNELNNFLIG